MVIGLSSAKAKGGKSILAVSASVNSQFNRFISKSKVCDISNGASVELESLFVDVFKLFYLTTKKYPERIIVLRDGLGDSQKPVLLTTEIPQIK